MAVGFWPLALDSQFQGRKLTRPVLPRESAQDRIVLLQSSVTWITSPSGRSLEIGAVPDRLRSVFRLHTEKAHSLPAGMISRAWWLDLSNSVRENDQERSLAGFTGQ